MNILTFGKHQETSVVIENMGRRSWRWAFVIERWGIGFEKQYTYEKGDGSWNPAGTYYMLYLRSKWGFGASHIYYDGSHCAWQLGPIMASWSSPNGCDKCESGMHE